MQTEAQKSTEIVPFLFEGESLVRAVPGPDGEPWFVAVDVCKVLGIKNNRDALDNLEADEKGVAIADTLGGRQAVGIVSESGLYALIFRSRKPTAVRFRKWIPSEVIPTLRKTGRYSMPDTQPHADQVGDLGTMRLWLDMVDQARKAAGPKAARDLWRRSPLPPLLEVTGDIPDTAADAAGEEEPLLATMLAMFQDQTWRGTAAELLVKLDAAAAPEDLARFDWPRTASQLGVRLRSLRTAFARAGISVQFRKGGADSRRFVHITPIRPAGLH